ncbi:MAG TPA: N-acetylglucosamine-6-phosphate deacetylase [Candidatus Dormibacteraeota bacterium]|nr:N-acetylglucosamine-6-phosphate deacetylase [Candidatus Dormibacteraeota bacterium]
MTREVLGGSVVGPNGGLRCATIVIEAGRVASVELAGPGDGEEIIVPGFIDLQVNGFSGHDAIDGPDAIRAISEELPRTGVTGFLPTLISRPLREGRRFVRAVAEAAAPGARVLGAHVEGPFLDPAHRGAHEERCLMPPTESNVSFVLEEPPRLLTLAPELEGGLEAVRRLAGAGVVVSAGHSGATYDEGLAAIEAGVRFATHLFNTMPPLHHRAPGLIGAVLDDPRVTAGIIADGIHVHPSLVAIAGCAKGPRGLALTTDQVAAAGRPPGRYLLAGLEVTREGDAVRLDDGTLAGSAATMDLLLRRAAEQFGLHRAVAMASRTPARVLGLGGLGRVAAGCDADLVVLGPDLRVRRTLVAGRTVYAA